MSSLGAKIRELRKEQGLTLNELAARIGISPSFLSAVERGQKKPSIPMVKKISEGLKVSAYYLLSENSLQDVGEKLRFVREGRGLSLEELAKMSGVGQETIRAIEAGEKEAELEDLERLADALTVTVRYFLDRPATSKSIGARIKSIREERGKTVAGLAEEIGVSPGLITQIEKDQTLPSFDTLEKIADALDMPVCYFLLEQQDVEDLLASLGPDVLQMLGDPRVQGVLRAVKDLTEGELKFILNLIHFFKKQRKLLTAGSPKDLFCV
ncbi:helix-turn-helix domain-containing protein [Calderihabitans maritimus]|uniref:Transcription factor, MBF1 like protein n=1 Tax=Calderihabitans maritimus TaxID=1246530 RepID=A0A1Z5HQC1_9FIRM|nr:helix-turn-helix domain-containing protein [Calderihabitans maritimus]GAW91714.1 transcription factor, MBF1 like protein [Calderihabitans maritimus]